MSAKTVMVQSRDKRRECSILSDHVMSCMMCIQKAESLVQSGHVGSDLYIGLPLNKDQRGYQRYLMITINKCYEAKKDCGDKLTVGYS